MDLFRRQASGTLAELLGPAALTGDVEARIIGLRRAAERSWPVLSPRVQAALSAYRDGVNSFLASHPLPLEYTLLELLGPHPVQASDTEPWSVIDSLVIVKALAFGLSFDLDIDLTVALGAYQAVLGDAAGGALFFEDLFRSAPFDTASTVPDAKQPFGLSMVNGASSSAVSASSARVATQAVKLGKRYMERVQGLRMFEHALHPHESRLGSNEWVVSGALTDTGRPLLANDPHLRLDFPATFYQVHLIAQSYRKKHRMDVIGSGAPGTPSAGSSTRRRPSASSPRRRVLQTCRPTAAIRRWTARATACAPTTPTRSPSMKGRCAASWPS